MKFDKKTSMLIIVFSLSFIISFFLINNILFSLLISSLTLLYSLKVIKQIIENQIYYKNLNTIYNFTNLMSIQFYTTKSVQEAFLRINDYLDNNFIFDESEDLISLLEQNADEYNINCYKMYVKTLSVYEKNGGDILKNSKIPNQMCQKSKVYYDKLLGKKRVKLFDITLLYILFILVFAFLKIGLSEYYNAMLNNYFYKFILVFIILSSFISYLNVILIFYKNNIRGL